MTVTANDVVWAPEHVATGAHCWHDAGEQPAELGCHDVICCWCGIEFSLGGIRRRDHGPFSKPGWEFMYPIATEFKCERIQP